VAVELAFEIDALFTFVENVRGHIDTHFSDNAERRNEFLVRHLLSACNHFQGWTLYLL
jgi:hypothetical protein